MPTATIGEIAYEGYRAKSDGKSLVSGAAIPPFEALSPAIKNAWEAAADALVAHMGRAEWGSATTGVNHT